MYSKFNISSHFLGYLIILSGTITGLFLGINYGSYETIETTETLRWSWGKFREGARNGFKESIDFMEKISDKFAINYCIYVHSWHFIASLYQFLHRIFILLFTVLSLLLGVIISIFWGISNGMTDEVNVRDNKLIPNQGIRRSLEIFIKVILIWISIFGLIGLTIGFVYSSNNESLGQIILILFGVFVGILLGLNMGGKACIQHFILRLILYCNGSIPWDYSRFLDYCTERLLLQRVGGRYRFIHKSLQEYFANSSSSN